MAKVRFFMWGLLIFAAGVLVPAGLAGAQALVLHVGEHQKLKPDREYTPEYLTFDQHRSFGFEIYWNDILEAKRNDRFGFRFSILTVEDELVPPYSEEGLPDVWLDYSLIMLLVNYQRRLWGEKSIQVLADMSVGIAFRSVENRYVYYTPKHALIDDKVNPSIQLGVCGVVRLYGNLGLQLSARVNLMPTGKEDRYPFSSGLLAEAGLLFELPMGD